MLLRRTAQALLTVLIVASGLSAAPAPAFAATLETASEAVALASVNGARAAAGLPALSPAGDLVAAARAQSTRMADQNRLHHNPSLTTDVKAWLALGENVGYGGSVASIHNALMNSSGHRANILGSAYSQVGIGAMRDGAGRLWITQVFRKPTAAMAVTPTPTPLGPSQPLPTMSSEPGAARDGGSVLLAERADNGSVGVRHLTDNHVGPATNLGGVVKGAAAVASDTSGRADVVVRGSDDTTWLRNRATSGSGFSGWQSLGGRLTAKPAVTSWGPGRLDVFGRGSDGQLWHRAQYSPGRWSSWSSLGGQLAADSAPAATSSGGGLLTVVVRGVDAQLWTRDYRPGGWTAWAPLGGAAVGHPTVTSTGPGQVVVAVKGTDGAGWARSLTTGWRPLGGQLSTSPTALSAPGSGLVEVLGVGTDRRLYRTALVRGTWQSWRRVG